VRRRPRPTFTARLVSLTVLVTVVIIIALAVVLDRTVVAGSADPEESRTILLLGLAVAAAAGLAALAFLTDRMTRPLRRITGAVSRIAAGQHEVRVPDEETLELGELAESLNLMAADLGARIEEARRERRTLETILAAMEEGVVLFDGEQTVRYANAAAGRLLGAEPALLRSMAPHPFQRLVADAREGLDSEGEVEVGLPARVIRASAIPIASRGEVLLVLRDVTAARRVEAMRRDFVANASHELKTPAASIQASAETLERALADDPEAAVRFAGRLRHDAERLARILSDLLDLSRLESERPALQPVRLDTLVAEEVARLRPDAREAGLSVSVQATPVTVPGSAKDLGLLTRNLLDNAIRYTPPGGRVRVEVGAEDGSASLTVRDTGIGIPTRDLPRIFERFYRVDRARSRETGGTGLGLSIARHVVEQHGGRIRAESELGRGSTFQVTLPLDKRTDAPARAS
jgi:two-component system phosphate regulon sensor histidine kinase PhoR